MKVETAHSNERTLHAYHRVARQGLMNKLQSHFHVERVTDSQFVLATVVEQIRLHRIQAILAIWDFDYNATPQWALDAMRSPELWNDSNIMQYENQIIPIQRVVGADVGVPIAKMVEIIDREKKKGLKTSQRSAKDNLAYKNGTDWHNGDSNTVLDSNTWCTFIGGALLSAMHDNYAKILVVVWSNDVAIPPCGFADDPLITIAYKEDDQRIRVRTALYSHRLNDLLYTIRLAYDDTSYIIVPEWGSSEPFEFSAHLTDDEVMHSLTFFDDIILREAKEYMRCCGQTKAWHYLEYLVAYVPHNACGTGVVDDDGTLHAHARALGRPIAWEKKNISRMNRTDATNYLAELAGQYVTHPTRFLPKLRQKMIYLIWNELGGASVAPTLPLMHRALAKDACYVAWHLRESLMDQFNILRISGVHVAAPMRRGGMVTIVRHNLIATDLPKEWPRSHVALLTRYNCKDGVKAEHQFSWTNHICQFIRWMERAQSFELMQPAQLNLWFGDLSCSPVAFSAASFVCTKNVHFVGCARTCEETDADMSVHLACVCK